MRFSELVDLGELQALCQSFTETTGIVTAILDLEGNILTATGWQEICTRYHRVCPTTAGRCRESDTTLASQLRQGQQYNVYRCQNGLVDVAVPILVEGEHVANFFIGQFLFAPPDQEYFRQQAAQFGFDPVAYLQALAKVPIYSETKVRSVMDFLARLARLIGEMGLARKRVEASNLQLQQYQEHLEELVEERTADLSRAQEIAHIGSWRWDLASGALLWSEEMYRIFGLPPGKPSPPTLETLRAAIAPEDRDQVENDLDQAIRNRKPFCFDFRTVPIAGEKRTIRVFGEVRCNGHGQAVTLAGADQDITEEKRVQSALAEAKDRAEAANRAKSTFLANMSHELRTPLNAILGFSRLMQDDPAATPAQITRLEIITRSGEHLLNLINNVLDISKIEAGYVEHEPCSCDLPQGIWSVVSLMRGQAAEKNLEFIVEQPSDLPARVIADEGKLRQVLLNLLGNAIKYTHQGQVGLRIRIVSPPTSDPIRLRFEVFDSGIGIPSEEMDRLFIPFVQLANRPPTEPGSGLGLAISKQYVELMGGVISASSVLGQGSIFSCEIPMRLASPEESFPAMRPGRITGLAAGQPCYRLLIAEDQPENRFLLRKLLEPLGCELREAVNGEEAVRIGTTWQPHLIWMDVRMPVLDGCEASRQIKAQATTTVPKIIALTAHALENERREILATGCDDLIRKPYQEGEIYQALARHLGMRFTWADEQPPSREQPPPLEARDLAELPRSWLEELTQAAERLDRSRSLLVVERIRQRNRPLGDHLQQMVEAFHYKPLLAALDVLTGRDTHDECV